MSDSVPGIIFHNARITTLDRGNPVASAVAIKDGRFLAPPGGEIVRDANGNPTGLLLAKPNAMILYATLAKGPKLPLDYQINGSARAAAIARSHAACRRPRACSNPTIRQESPA